MRTEITPGQDTDYTCYDMVVADNLPQPAFLVADRGYDSDKIREDIENRNALPMIPMRKNRKVRKAVDMAIYTLRNMVERCFNRRTVVGWQPATTKPQTISSASSTSHVSGYGSPICQHDLDPQLTGRNIDRPHSAIGYNVPSALHFPGGVTSPPR